LPEYPSFKKQQDAKIPGNAMENIPKIHDPLVKTEFGSRHLSDINRILLISVQKIGYHAIPYFADKEIKLAVGKNSRRDSGGRLYSWAAFSLMHKYPDRNALSFDWRKPYEYHNIKLVEGDIPRAKSEVEAETRHFLENAYGRRLPKREKYHGKRSWLGLLLLLALLLSIILSIILLLRNKIT
jgi:hypothetical protein